MLNAFSLPCAFLIRIAKNHDVFAVTWSCDLRHRPIELVAVFSHDNLFNPDEERRLETCIAYLENLRITNPYT